MTALTYIAHGEFFVGRRENDLFAATLGSCVSVCLFDQHRRLGGMNHMLLPGSSQDVHDCFGSADMEKLINAMLRHGASRSRMTAKVFGGAAMLVGNSDIGTRNAAFAADYLEREGIPIIARSTGGRQARQIKFYPSNGSVKHRLVAQHIEQVVPGDVSKNDVELF